MFCPSVLQSIDPGQQFTWENSNLEVNKPKNRYANVIAYDHSRVVLTPVDGKSKTRLFYTIGQKFGVIKILFYSPTRLHLFDQR